MVIGQATLEITERETKGGRIRPMRRNLCERKKLGKWIPRSIQGAKKGKTKKGKGPGSA